MNVTFTSVEDLICPHLKDLSNLSSSHVNQPHLPITSLPSPAAPLSISSFPVEISDEKRSINPKRVANLWLQLLSIHIQSGSFWRYDDVLRAHQEAEARSREREPTSPMDAKSGALSQALWMLTLADLGRSSLYPTQATESLSHEAKS